MEWINDDVHEWVKLAVQEGIKLHQQAVDEEGCGAVMVVLKMKNPAD